MGRKGDIDSKSVASRVPMGVYLKLLGDASANNQTISAYVAQILANHNNFRAGGSVNDRKIILHDKTVKISGNFESQIECLINELVEQDSQIKKLKKIQENDEN